MKDIIAGMTHSMHQMAYYLVIMFFIAQFVYAFGASNLGTLLALAGAAGASRRLRDLPAAFTDRWYRIANCIRQHLRRLGERQVGTCLRPFLYRCS